MTEDAGTKPVLERALAKWLFRARWLQAPIYFGLVLALLALVVVFAQDTFHLLAELLQGGVKHVIAEILSLIDLSLTGNLIVLVMFTGYEQFVSRIEVAERAERLSWMGALDFSGLKLKLIASLVAISGIAMLRVFVEILDEPHAVDDRTLAWLVGMHIAFVVSGLLLAVMDFVASKAHRP